MKHLPNLPNAKMNNLQTTKNVLALAPVPSKNPSIRSLVEQRLMNKSGLPVKVSELPLSTLYARVHHTLGKMMILTQQNPSPEVEQPAWVAAFCDLLKRKYKGFTIHEIEYAMLSSLDGNSDRKFINYAALATAMCVYEEACRSVAVQVVQQLHQEENPPMNPNKKVSPENGYAIWLKSIKNRSPWGLVTHCNEAVAYLLANGDLDISEDQIEEYRKMSIQQVKVQYPNFVYQKKEMQDALIEMFTNRMIMKKYAIDYLNYQEK